MDCVLVLSKSASTTQAVVSDIITYTLEVKNLSNSVVNEVVVKDLLTEELKFVLGSVQIDYLEDTSSNIISGVKLGSIEANGTKIVSFDAEIIKKSEKYIVNKSMVEYKYTDDNKYRWSCGQSNEVYILIKNPKITVYKEADKKSAQLGDEINFTIRVCNTGDLNVENVLLIDNISESFSLIDGSFKINDMVINSVELNKGVALNNLPISCQLIIKYTVKVVSGGCCGKICNECKVKYSYTLPNGFTNYKESNPSKVCIDMSISSFKQISIDEYLTIPAQKPDIKEINDIKAEINIDKYNIITTPVSKSSEGQYLSGYKLIVHGKISQVIEYIACEPTQSVHSAHYNAPFSTYIVLPKDFKPGNNIKVDGIVEDIYFDVIDERCFFKNLTLILIAKIISFKDCSC